MRERFGIRVFMVQLVVLLGVTILVLAAEMGGVAAALGMVFAVHLPIWAVPVGVLCWFLLWRAPFGVIETGGSLLGLVTIAFAVAAVHVRPDYGGIARGVMPSFPNSDAAHYWFIAVSVLGASVSPYLYYFYSSGAIEEKWDASYLATNRVVAALGMGFGGFLSMAIVIVAAHVYQPGSAISSYQQLPRLLVSPFGRVGFWLFIASLVVACLGATVEIALSLAYAVAQGLGWNWGEDLSPREDARFALTYTLIVAAGTVFVVLDTDPLKLTAISMALTAASLPLGTFPFLLLMNDREYLGEHTNGHIGNAAVLAISVLAGVLGVVSIPLQLIGG
jgi:Mn2+/Fe2+ NRAMP family transporter